MRLDGARVQAETVELSRSRCPGCCQRLGAGEEPADGDRVAGKGEEAERSREPARIGPGVGPQDQEMIRDQDWEVVGAQ